jgi:hypothetical protein
MPPQKKQPEASGFWKTLGEFWKLVVVTTRYALVARFCVIAGLAAAFAFLAVDQGRELLRALAEPRAPTFAYNLTGDVGTPAASLLPWNQIGWFSFGVIVLSLACWASTRLCYGLDPDTETGDNLVLEQLMERKLPMYFGALPLVVAGIGFLQEAFTYLPADRRPLGLAAVVWAVPLGVLFGVPALVILRWLWLRRTQSALTQEGPGLRFLLYVCNLLPLLGGIYLACRRSELPDGFPVVLSALLLAQYFFALAIGIYHFEIPWLIALPGIALPFTFGLIEPGEKLSLFGAAFAHIILGAVVWRIKIGDMQRQLHVPKELNFGQIMRMIFFLPAPPQTRVGHQETRTLRAAGAVFIILLVALVCIWADHQWLPRIFGPAAVVCLGLTGLVVLGNGLLVATRAVRFPLISFALVWALICSVCEDNHTIRFVKPAAHAGSDTTTSKNPPPLKHYADVQSLFRDWHDRVRARYPLKTQNDRRPCYIVATEGGGIRAAFWTAQVLARLEDNSRTNAADNNTPDFGSHVLAISGVSGGSLGASLFTALYADSDTPRENEKTGSAYTLGRNAAFILGSDHLSPLVGTMLFPDALQRFWPWTLPGTDRGAALEVSWENRWRFYLGESSRNRFHEPFLDLWKDHLDSKQSWLPALFLNATRVEDGRRIIASNVRINSGPKGDFPDALDLHDYLWPQSNVVHGPWERLSQLWRNPNELVPPANGQSLDVPLSTATHCSARFTYFSPAARLPSGHRVVDGGYYEDSGAETAGNILAAIKDPAAHDVPEDPVEPIIILIRYIDRDAPDQPEFSALVPGPASPTVAAYAYSDLLSPLLALAGVRDAHATDQYASFGWLELHSNVPAYPFQLAQRGIPLPLGWTLCGRAAGEMVREMPDQETATDPKVSGTIDLNRRNLGAVLDRLSRMNVR